MSDSACKPPCMKEFFLARQPILNRAQDLFAYELLFRGAAAGPAEVIDDVSATASVIAHASELGLENVVGDSLGFVNVDEAVLMSDFIQFLPKSRVVLEILETVKASDQLTARVAELKRAGYMFALDDIVAESDSVQRLLPHVEIVKIDISNMPKSEVIRLGRKFQLAGKRLLAEKVETLVQFRHCLDLGFDYFQGYYFAKPMILTGRKLSHSQMVVMRLLAHIMSNADAAVLERSVKQDASLGQTLLRMVNTAASGVRQPIDSIDQALTVMGRQQLQRWLHILLYAELGKSRGSPAPLLALATTRSKLLELVAQKIRPGDRNTSDTAFTVGIMSLMDALFGLPMEDILKRFPVSREVADALLTRSGLYGDMLKLAEYIEHLKEAGPLVPPLLEKLQLSTEDLYALELDAFGWSDTICATQADAARTANGPQ
ncbi:MAG: EAL and HDOD domain-containing protein [Noviherbaspirillum sp.]